MKNTFIIAYFYELSCMIHLFLKIRFVFWCMWCFMKIIISNLVLNTIYTNHFNFIIFWFLNCWIFDFLKIYLVLKTSCILKFYHKSMHGYMDYIYFDSALEFAIFLALICIHILLILRFWNSLFTYLFPRNLKLIF